MEANWLRSQFAGRLVSKEYLCLCEGPFFEENHGKVTAPLLTIKDDATSRSEVSPQGRKAMTKYSVLERFRPTNCPKDHEVTLLSVKPLTGRTHQIRVHMASIHRPLAGDWTYGLREQSSILLCPRLFLHCHRVELIDINDGLFSAEAPLPEDLLGVLRALKPFAVEPSTA